MPNIIYGSCERIEMYRLTARSSHGVLETASFGRRKEPGSLLGHQSPELAVQLSCTASVVYNVL